jgi:hypothetical protein
MKILHGTNDPSEETLKLLTRLFLTQQELFGFTGILKGHMANHFFSPFLLSFASAILVIT